MAACDPCTRALVERHHEYVSGCPGCQARSLARAPDFIRGRYLETLPEGERAAMLDSARAAWKHEQEQSKVES